MVYFHTCLTVWTKIRTKSVLRFQKLKLLFPHPPIPLLNLPKEIDLVTDVTSESASLTSLRQVTKAAAHCDSWAGIKLSCWWKKETKRDKYGNVTGRRIYFGTSTLWYCAAVFSDLYVNVQTELCRGNWMDQTFCSSDIGYLTSNTEARYRSTTCLYTVIQPAWQIFFQPSIPVLYIVLLSTNSMKWWTPPLLQSIPKYFSYFLILCLVHRAEHVPS